MSSDEVFTPPTIANEILDTIPKDFWSDPNKKVLDPTTKSGVFLREAAKRFMFGLADKIPNANDRINHILKNQLYGLPITELTSLISRRTLYFLSMQIVTIPYLTRPALKMVIFHCFAVNMFGLRENVKNAAQTRKLLGVEMGLKTMPIPCFTKRVCSTI